MSVGIIRTSPLQEQISRGDLETALNTIENLTPGAVQEIQAQDIGEWIPLLIKRFSHSPEKAVQIFRKMADMQLRPIPPAKPVSVPPAISDLLTVNDYLGWQNEGAIEKICKRIFNCVPKENFLEITRYVLQFRVRPGDQDNVLNKKIAQYALEKGAELVLPVLQLAPQNTLAWAIDHFRQLPEKDIFAICSLQVTHSEVSQEAQGIFQECFNWLERYRNLGYQYPGITPWLLILALYGSDESSSSTENMKSLLRGIENAPVDI